MKLKRKLLLIMMMINILSFKNLINKLTAENVTARIAQASLVSKSDIANFVKKTYLNKNESNELSKKLKQYQQKD